jgi:hypothetical protein
MATFMGWCLIEGIRLVDQHRFVWLVPDLNAAHAQRLHKSEIALLPTMHQPPNGSEKGLSWAKDGERCAK